MTPLQEVRYGCRRPNNRGCWMCENYQIVPAGKRQWSQKRKLCRLTGKILFSMKQCPLAVAAQVE